jgi:hypothetical protein
MILEQVFINAIYKFNNEHYLDGLVIGENSHRGDVGLLLVSRQMNAETALLPYELGSFTHHGYWEALDRIPGWYRCFGYEFFLEKISRKQIEAVGTLVALVYYGCEIDRGTWSDLAVEIERCSKMCSLI